MACSRGIILWGMTSIFFALQFIIRLSTGILREDIMSNFAIDTIAFGTLSGYYYLGYAGLQIPVGILLDRFGIKVITSIFIIVTAIGSFIFVTSINFNALLISRLVIGAGSAVGFLSVAKVITYYFADKHHSTMLGLSFTLGLLGALFAITPMKIIFSFFGYKNTFYAIIVLLFIIACFILLLKTDDSFKYQDSFNQSFYSDIKVIILFLINPKILFIALCGGLMVGALEGFADLWSIQFFKQVYNMSDIKSNLVTSFIYFGMCFGGPLLGAIANIVKSLDILIIFTGTITIVIFLILFYFSFLEFYTSCILMFILGIVCCYQVIIFCMAGNIVSGINSGLAIAIVNCINMSFGHFFHVLISYIISHFWDGASDIFGAPIYSRNAFVMSLSVIPICSFLAIIGIGLFFKKIKNRSEY